jgi:DNA-binding transcriptional MerR regulator
VIYLKENNAGTQKKIPMRELEKLTNMTRATINFYIKEGLLPLPQKSAKNMAYYDEEFIEKLKFIEKMRNADFTLNQIKRLVNFDTNTVNDFGLQILESVNRLLPYGIDEKPVTMDQIKEIGFSDETIKNFIEMRIINSIDKNNKLFPSYSITVCRFIKYFMDFGIPLTVANEILLKLKELADIEKNAFINYIRSPMLEHNLSQDEQRREVQKCIESINGLLPILHLQFIKMPNEIFRKSGIE